MLHGIIYAKLVYNIHVIRTGTKMMASFDIEFDRWAQGHHN